MEEDHQEEEDGEPIETTQVTPILMRYIIKKSYSSKITRGHDELYSILFLNMHCCQKISYRHLVVAMILDKESCRNEHARGTISG